MSNNALDRATEVIELENGMEILNNFQATTSSPVEHPDSCLTAALSYAELGWKVLPVKAFDKEPCMRGWQQSATSKPELISKYWKQFPDASVGILLGRSSGLVVLDVDMPYGYESLEMLKDDIGCSIETDVMTFTPSGGCHLYFTYPRGHAIKTKGKIEGYPNLEILSESSMCLAPPSKRTEGVYEWEASSDPFQCSPSHIPHQLLDFILQNQKQQKDRRMSSGSQVIPEGIRNTTLASMAGSMQRKGMTENAIAAALKEENRTRCKPPLSNVEVKDIVSSISQYAPDDPACEVCSQMKIWVRPTAPECSFDDVQSAARALLPGCDLGLVRIVIASYHANLLPGRPPWLMAVGGSSSGKSEILTSLEELPLVTTADNLTRSALVSGTARSKMRSGDPGGMLMEIGDKGIMVIPDMSTIMALSSKHQRELMGILRRVYDGKYYYQPGDGSHVRQWTGKLGLIAAVTGEIDARTGFMADLGQRFLIIREKTDALSVLQDRTPIPSPDQRSVLRKHLKHTTMGLAAGFSIETKLNPLPEYESSVIKAAANLTSSIRSPIKLDSKGIPQYAPPREMPYRLIEELASLYRSLRMLGCTSEASLRDVVRTAMDTISPPMRRDVLFALFHSDNATCGEVAKMINAGKSSVSDVLNVLTMLQILDYTEENGIKQYRLTELARTLFEQIQTHLRSEGQDNTNE